MRRRFADSTEQEYGTTHRTSARNRRTGKAQPTGARNKSREQARFMAEQAQAAVTNGTKTPELVKGLGLFDSTMIVCGSMIGSGIFIVSADIVHQMQSPALLLVVWVVAGIMTLI